MIKQYISESVQIGSHEALQIKLKNENTRFSVIPGYGSCLNSFVVKGRPIIVSADNENEFNQKTIKEFAGAQLFPFPNRVENAVYNYLGKTYNLPKNDSPLNHANHTLVYNHAFKIEEIDSEQGKVTTSLSYHKDDAGYLFDFELRNTFQLSDNALTTTTHITNLSDQIIPFGHGWHPYFLTPGKVDQYYLQLQGEDYYLTDETLIPTGEIAQLKRFLTLNQIGSTDLNQCFKLFGTGNGTNETLLTDAHGDFKVKLLTQGYSYIQIYIHPDRNYIALEPQTAIPNAINNRIGCLYLKPHESLNLSFKIEVEF